MSAAPLLATKLFAPQPGPKRVLRPRLLARLERCREPGRRLALICAPAGYGKTTLAGEWVQTQPGLIAWLSLDPHDNDPNQFLAYLVAALRLARPGFGRAPEAYLQALEAAALQPALAELINDLTGLDEPVLLVLDDYQSINLPAIHEGLGFLLDHLPPQVRLALVTRTDPPLPLHRYRARAQMVELRAEDLRFSTDETTEFFARAAGLNLQPAELAVLDERIEGWAAGIQMAALSFERQPDVSRFIQSLGGSRRYILDYLAEEVLNSQPEELRHFLLQISILERFCAALCDTVTGGPAGSSARHLASIERQNLFLVPLDAEGRWYRFHHLFAGLLRVRLKQPGSDLGPEQALVLQQRASLWLEANGFLREAIHHALEAGDYERAADLVEGSTVALLGRGELHALLSWIEVLPAETIERRPWLCLAQAWTLGFNGRAEEAARRLHQAQAGLQNGAELAEAARRQLTHEIFAVRMLVTVSAGRPADAAELEEASRAAPLPGGQFAQSVICWAWGYVCRSAGRLDEAAAAFEKVMQIGRALENQWTFSVGAVDYATILRQRGRLRQAVQVYRQGLEQVLSRTAYAPGFIGRMESLLGVILCEQNELAEAHRLIEASLEHNRWWRNPNHDTHAWLARAALAQAEGDLPGMRAALEAARLVTAQFEVVALLRSGLESLWVQYWLASADQPAAAQWATAHAAAAAPDAALVGEALEIERLALARIWAAAGQKPAALRLLKLQAELARASGRIGPLIETLVLQALAGEDFAEAQAALGQALALAAPEGYMRVFVNLGQPMLALLAARAQEPDGYVRALLAAFPVAAAPASPQPAGPAGPLSARELGVLGCLAQGLTNPQIGARLFIATGTVKAHTAAIFRKLDVANRTEAVARANDLGLL